MDQNKQDYIESVKQLLASATPASLRSDAEDISALRRAELQKAFSALTPGQAQFISYVHSTEQGEWSEIDKLRAALSGRQYARPSEYVNTLDWLFGAVIPEDYRQEVLDAVDRCLATPYSTGMLRRSLRSGDPAAYTTKIRQLLSHFAQDRLLRYDLASLLTGQVSEAVRKYLGNAWGHNHYALPWRIAGALDRNDEAVSDAVRELLAGDSQSMLLEDVIQGVVLSERSDMHELLGRLLLAARLQEGLRQAICERADMGTKSAFMAILSVIADNDLIRFSSVKRAVGVWLGLMSSDTTDMERISAKSVTLMRRCLTEDAFREECLASEDCMAIHIGLWAVGFHDVQEAVRRAEDMALHGSHHQRLTCGYFAAALHEQATSSRLARRVISAFPEETDTLAVYLPLLASDLPRRFYERHCGDGSLRLTNWYADEAECRAMVALLQRVRTRLKKKLVFDPCIFPWYRATLDKPLLAEKLLSSAALVEDDALLDSLLPLLPETPVDSSREYLLSYCCGKPRTPAQRKALLSALCDKGEWVRRKAAELAATLSISAEDCIILEDLLRFKYADARQNVTRLLLRQDDEGLCASITRLLTDKTEERRIAALDMLHAVAKEGKRPAVIERCRPLLAAMTAPAAKEKALLESVRGLLGGVEAKAEAEAADPLFGEAGDFQPNPIDRASLEPVIATFARYFPGSKLPEQLSGKQPGLFKRLFKARPDMSLRDQAQEDVASLTRLLLAHANDEIRHWSGETTLLSAVADLCRRSEPGGAYLFGVWKGWYETELQSDPFRLLRACILANTHRAQPWTEDVQTLFGPGFHEEKLHCEATKTSAQLTLLLIHLAHTFVPALDQHHLALALMVWQGTCLNDDKLWRVVTRGNGLRTMASWMPFHSLEPAAILLHGLSYADEATFPLTLNAVMLLHTRMGKALQRLQQEQPNVSLHESQWAYGPLSHHCTTGQTRLNTPLLVRAAARGLLPRQAAYTMLLKGAVDQRQGMLHLSLLSSYHRLQGAKPSADRWGRFARDRAELQKLYLGHEEAQSEDDAALLAFADEMCQPLLDRIIDAEIRRGDAPGDFTRIASGMTRVDGMERFVRILAALGRDKLIRVHLYSTRNSRTEVLCGLLRKCVPLPTDTAEGLRALLKQHSIKNERLIEAALYVPAWIEMCEEALALPGFTSAAYYFIAHMNEDFDDARLARIARFTPLTADELQNGAFDITWFRSAYETLGAETFEKVYDAAKYITDGAKHARARKYADAVLGRLDAQATQKEIADKRNKDLLRAWPLIPLKGEADVQARYLYLQQFLKESRTFGAQRAASEKTAVEIAMQNLAMNAGYADSMRLTLRMETRLTEENAGLFEPHSIGDVTLRLVVDAQGLPAIECLKAGKAQKSIPAALKRNEYIQRLTDMKKQLTEQHRRARRMLEEAMENSSVFTAGEIAALERNPVLAPMLACTVFMQEGRFGFVRAMALTEETGAVTPLAAEDTLIIAHPYHLRQAKKWLPFQRLLFKGRIVQPFRQVFRELYIKTPEEAARTTSLRYAGHQLQPRRTLACLKERRWLADPEAGLQKVYYQENIIATIWALADWFTPADIEAPTLEHVAFLDRKTGKPLAISQVPDVLFSEVMRDVDLAVSVAHAGGVDPESSHSTIEMRAALLNFTLPLFRLTNVRIEGSHALIDGQLARYSVHLGSGVVHQLGGTMLSVLPVHSQHRGRLFLPFADDDPKTAEILSKVLLFAEDKKIKDPTILTQIIQ